MAKDHLKRLAAPKTWLLQKKESTFITRPRPGRGMDLAMSLNQVMKVLLTKATTTKEVKNILQHEEVLVNGKRVHDHRRPVGFMDILTFPKIKEAYILSLSKKGKLKALQIDIKDSNKRIVKIRNKTRLKGKTQINCYDGSNFFVEKDDYKAGDSILLKDGKISKGLPLITGAIIMLTGGRHLASIGKVKAVEGRTIFFTDEEGTEFSTARKYAYVVGEKEAEVELR